MNIIDVCSRVPFQRDDGKGLELDVVAESSCGQIIVVEVKKTQAKTGVTAIEDFLEKLESYAKHVPEHTLLPAFLSLGGFTEEALHLCRTRHIGTAEIIAYF